MAASRHCDGEVRLVLEDLGLTSFLKTTGGKGLHIVVPIEPRTGWDDAKAFCKGVADLIVRACPTATSPR